MVLILDIETTGKPIRNDALISDLNNWPRIVEIAWQKYSHDHVLIEEYNSIIFPKEFEIPLDSSNIHGISTKFAIDNGRDIEQVLLRLNDTLTNVELVVAHNIDFDINILKSEYFRLGLGSNLQNKEFLCTMKSSINYCAGGSQIQNKYPSLKELYYKIFQTNFENHNAILDVRATSKCFWFLSDNRIIENKFNKPFFKRVITKKPIAIEDYRLITIENEFGKSVFVIFLNEHYEVMAPLLGIEDESLIDVDLPVYIICYEAQNSHLTNYKRIIKKGEQIWFAKQKFN